MRKQTRRQKARHGDTATRERGFTLIEMMVSLAIGALIIGAVMGLISESIRYRINLKEKAYIQPILESAAQVILADPVKAMAGFISLGEIGGSAKVGVYLLPVPLAEESEGGGKSGRLYRVTLNYGSSSLEFSIIIPNKDLK
ncbi:MAG TPA: type II secretion system protein [Deltaproteobacteria bacterium]|nr:type II secretion system protein [Deltaproteobacteria bacterium]